MASLTPSDDKQVQLVSQETPYQGYFRLDRFELRHSLHAGGWTPILVRELFERGNTAVVLPYDPQRDTVVLVEQFRIGAYAAGLSPWLSEAVAGIIETGEAAEDVVRRESMEEANCPLQDLVTIGRFVMSPGASSETCSMFCGRIDSAGVGGIHGVVEEGEDIKATVQPADYAIKQVLSGEIVSAYAVILLLWLAAKREELRTRWA
ncbi:MAG: NUDIX domain-containing protein [Pseudomonadota bacterium]